MLIRLLRVHLRPMRGLIAVVVLLQLVQTAATLLLPALNADIIDNGVVSGDTAHVVDRGAVMVAVVVVQIVCAIGAILVGTRVAMAVGRDVRASMFRRVVRDFSAQDAARFGTASLITRTVNDVQQVQTLVLTALVLLVSVPIMGIGGVVMALQQDVALSAVLVALAPALALSLGVVYGRVGPLYGVMQAGLDRLNQVLREQITGVRVVRAFVRDAGERARFTAANTGLLDVSLKVGRLVAPAFPLILLVMNLASIAVVWWGADRVDSGEMRIGALTAFLSYLMLIMMSTLMGMSIFTAWPRAAASAARITELVDTEPSVVPPAVPVRDLPAPGRIELRGAEFRYPGAENPVLREVDLVVEPGRTLAVIGSTGSGKTTLLNLVRRLYDASAGTVSVHGVDVRDLDPSELARTVGVVPQRAHLFSGTVATNLRFGAPGATDDELWEALEVAQAAEFVRRLPLGLDAPVAQGGSNLSGGQRQRLSIARALVVRPTIYLFDDSFSALDNATDRALRAALASATAGATCVVVAQRVSTIRDADRIAVLDGGRVVGLGTHHDLMADNPTYREIVLSQLTEQEAS